MLIRFYCKRCKQLLGISTQKVGIEIACPRCGLLQIAAKQSGLPVQGTAEIAEGGQKPEDAFRFSQLTSQLADQRNPETVADPGPQGEPTAKDSPTPDDVLDVESVVVPVDPMATNDSEAGIQPSETDVEPIPAPQDVATEVSQGEAPPPKTEEPAPPQPPAVRRSPSLVPSDMILFPRRMLFVQAILFPVIAIVALLVGYFIGRGGATNATRSDQKAAAGDRVPVEGKVLYDPGTGDPIGDEGAVVIVLPSGKTPTSRLLAEAIRPSDSPLPETHRTLSVIRDFGGGYARADASGEFSFFLPDRGKYRVLVVSRHATRPHNTKTNDADLAEMGKYFEQPSQLLRACKYRWTSEEIHVGMQPIEVDFGRDGQE